MVPIGWFFYPPSTKVIPFLGIPVLLYLAVGTQIAALRPIPWRTGYQTVVDPLLIATGLQSPGGGVALVAWLALFDGRVPGRKTTWWAFVFNRAMYAIAHVLPSVAVSSIGGDTWWGLPVRTAVYVLASVGINYFLTGLGVTCSIFIGLRSGRRRWSAPDR